MRFKLKLDVVQHRADHPSTPCPSSTAAARVRINRPRTLVLIRVSLRADRPTLALSPLALRSA